MPLPPADRQQRQQLFGPFRAVPGKQASQMNFKVGGEPSSLGYSYQISVEGCD